jgi:2-methylcitrate dehydratase PrpD
MDLGNMREQAIAERVADFVYGCSYDAIPADVIESAKLHLLDTIGCGLAAPAGGAGQLTADALEHAGGREQSSVIGGSRRLPQAEAAFANATKCHGMEYDDTHTRAIAHVSSVVAPASIAVAEATEASGSTLLTALVLGNEVVARVAAAVAQCYMQSGFHPTSVCGVFGAATSAAKLMAGDREVIANALGIAGSMASGIFEYLEDGSDTKPINAGWAAHGGVTSATLASCGVTGPRTVFEGRYGLLHAYFDFDVAKLDAEIATLGEQWETPAIAFKPYPACHFIHSCLDAIASIVAETAIPASDVGEVVVSIPSPGAALVLEPPERKIAPATVYDARFSMPYSLAAMLVHGRVGLDTYSPEALADDRVLDVARRVSYEPAEFSNYPGGFPGRVRLITTDGRIYSSEVQFERGSVSNPMPKDAIVEKFRTNAATMLDERSARALEAAVLHLEEVSDVRSAFGTLMPRTGSRTH